jgi:hypothetical protein
MRPMLGLSSGSHQIAWRPGCTTAADMRRGDAQGGLPAERFGTPLVGGAGARSEPALFAGEAACPSVGGTVPAPASPWGE